MLLQAENTTAEQINQLLAYARKNHISLSVVDDAGLETTLPGKPLTAHQLTQLIKKSRQSGIISMKDAHGVLRHGYTTD